MAQKSNIRSMRFSDEIIQMIESQAGETFTAKFEALVTRCMWELPQKEHELARINEEIRARREQLGRMTQRVTGYMQALQRMESNLKELDRQIAKAQELEW